MADLDLAIVTSCTPNYAKYLGEWALSIAGLKTKPALCCVVMNGEDHTAEALMVVAIKRLQDAGIPTRHTIIPATDLGSARNAAVALSDTEWVQHFDCDDLAMPHMLCEVKALAPNADVVCLGYERSGDLRAGPANRKKLYKSSQGQSTLDSTAPASGVSPFRRSFWERSPYRTDMTGGWDTALWLGFAHLNARFVASKRHCFYYRQHADSVFNTRRLDRRLGYRVGCRLRSLRRGDMGTSLIVPLAANNHPSRVAAWEWLRKRYERHLPELEIVTAEYNGTPWNKGHAVNEAVERSTGEVLVIADADCWIDPAVIRSAVDRVRSSEAPWIVPHGDVHRLSEQDTADLLEIEPDEDVSDTLAACNYIRKPYPGYAGGGLVVVLRPSFDYAGRFPDRFQGWGAEDEAFALVLDTLLGEHVRLGAPLWHLWHPPGRRTADPYYRRNRQTWMQYHRARGKPEMMWQVVNGIEERRHKPKRDIHRNARARVRAA